MTVVAVDGPAASGKGTIARAIAAYLGLPLMDTGLLYRAVGLSVLRANEDPFDAAAAVRGCGFDDALLADPDLRGDAAAQAASAVSAVPAVRQALLARQTAFARRPGGAVLDGRDIGTVIAPAADAKLFVTASADVRAARRLAELRARGVATTQAAVLADIRARDMRDSQRAAAPLRRADDADLLDTSDLAIAVAVQRAIALVEARIKV